MKPALEILDRLHSLYGKPFVITSTDDGSHCKDSYHWQHHAFDFREYPPTNQRILELAKQQLPRGFRILFEGVTAPAFHVEFHPEEVNP